MKFVYDTIFRRTSTYFVGIVASVFFFERAFDLGSEAIFDSVNRGVSELHNLSGCVRILANARSFACRNNGRTSSTSTNERDGVNLSEGRLEIQISTDNFIVFH